MTDATSPLSGKCFRKPVLRYDVDGGDLEAEFDEMPARAAAKPVNKVILAFEVILVG